jgi:hypothetical protein
MGTSMLAVIEGLLVKFLTPRERGHRGATAGALGLERGGRSRWIDGEEEVVLWGFCLSRSWLGEE